MGFRIILEVVQCPLDQRNVTQFPKKFTDFMGAECVPPCYKNQPFSSVLSQFYPTQNNHVIFILNLLSCLQLCLPSDIFHFASSRLIMYKWTVHNFFLIDSGT
jgi:hypothetical protein